MPTEPITTAGYRITDTLQLITIVLFTMHRSTTDGDTITIPGTDITTTITLLIAYPSASPWLTDYILSENLRAAYAAGLAGEAQPYGPSGEDLASLWSSDSLITSNLEAIYGAALQVQKAAPASQAELTPEVKQALADEVKTQIADKAAAEKSQDSAGKGDELPAALDPKHRIFVVASTITVTATEDGSECQWTQGDIIERASGTADSDNNVEMIAKSTRKEDCSRNAHVSVPANELQEMHNHFRETLQTGMKSLADNSGKDGLQSARHCHSGR